MEIIHVDFSKWDGTGLRMHRHFKKPARSCALDNEKEATLIGSREMRQASQKKFNNSERCRAVRRAEFIRSVFGDDTRHLAGGKS